MEQLSVWKVECDVKIGAEETLLTYEQIEIRLSMDHGNTERIADDSMGPMVI